MLVLGGCGPSSVEARRQAVNSYLGRIDRTQQHFAPSFKLANQAYLDLANGKPSPRQLQRLRGAEVAILAARNALQHVQPPAEAANLHRDLLRLYALDATLGLEAISLQQFLPGVRDLLAELGRRNRSYRRDLARATSVDGQVAALEGYSRAVATIGRRLRHLAAPSALNSWQDAQVAYLKQLVVTGRSLATALRLNDRNATPLVRQFRFLVSHQPSVSRAEDDAVKAYDNQVLGISNLQAKIASEHQRLQNELG